MTSRPIRFVHRGQLVEVADAAPTCTVLDWLRGPARCTGTKEGCAEGDCGACTVAVGSLDAGARLRLATVNACIQFLPMLDGKALFTIEDLSPPAGPLHPVQKALVDHHGSQCGFCTPGIAMSLWACRERHLDARTRPSRQALADELAGNLCRCTGYRPILDAGERMFDTAAGRLDAAPVAALLRQLAADPPLAYRQAWWSPQTVDELARLRAERPSARLVAGATDVALWVNKQFRELPEIIWTGAVADLRSIEERQGALYIGAAATLDDAWSALAERWPWLEELWLRFASPPVRHAGTLGGNVANGSPIGDATPALLALDARVVLQRLDEQRELPLCAFYTGYQRNALHAGEFLRGVVVPASAPGTVLRAYKVAKRFDSDISAVCGAFALELDRGVVRAARLAYGGMAAVVKRAAAAEAALIGQPWTEGAAARAAAALASDFQPLTDLRASADYRLEVAGNLLHRCWLETRVASPLPAAAVSAFARGMQA